MWSPTKLNFLFYDFFTIYYNFSKIQEKQIKNKKTKLCYCSQTTVQNHLEELVDQFWKVREVEYLVLLFGDEVVHHK